MSHLRPRGPLSPSLSQNHRTGRLSADIPGPFSSFLSRLLPGQAFFRVLSDLGCFLRCRCAHEQRGLQRANLACHQHFQDKIEIESKNPNLKSQVKLCYRKQASTGCPLGVPSIPTDKESPLRIPKGLPRRQSGWKVTVITSFKSRYWAFPELSSSFILSQ